VADFEWAVGIEDTFIGHPSGRRRRILDEYELIDHYRRWRSDFDHVASLGVRSIRYGVPWYRVNPQPGVFDWAWTDAVFEHLDRRGLRPIVDLVHYGTPLWLRRSFVDPDYPPRVAEYAAAMVERYGRLAGGWTPLNEPVVNADLSGMRGVWPPHLRGRRGYDRVLLGIVEGMARTIAAIRSVDPAARIVAVEPCDVVTTEDESLEPVVEARWHELFLPLDLLLGRVDERHPLHERLLASGIEPERLAAVRANPQRVDVVGVNFYPHMSHAELVRADGAVRRRNHYATGQALATALTRFQAHAGLPVMLTETSDNASVERRARWMDESIVAVAGLREAGVPVVGYTWFPVLSHIDWRWRRGANERSAYWCHMGLWDIDEDLNRRPTPLVDRYAAFVAGGAPSA
jgi:beta-glucosidase/6-phospho-beta-glucosidase/beta-galactosidase